jgi:DNA-directed RNA polymerase specialized sigma24 family protein
MTNNIDDLYERLQDHTRRASNEATSLEYFAAGGPGEFEQPSTIQVLRAIQNTMTQLSEAATIAVELSIRAGNSQKETADALGVPASTLAGAKKEFVRQDA